MARRLAMLGMPTKDLDHLPDSLEIGKQQLDLCDRHLFYTSRDSHIRRPLLEAIPAYHLAYAASKWSVATREIEALADPLRAVGYPIAKLHGLGEELRLDDIQQRLVALLPSAESLTSQRVPIGALLDLAEDNSLTLGETIDHTTALEPLGIVLPEISEAQRSFRPNTTQTMLLQEGFGSEPRWTDAITVAAILAASEEWRTPIDDVIEDVEPLSELGIMIASVPPDVRKHLEKRQLFLDVLDLAKLLGRDKAAIDAWDICTEIDPAGYLEALEVLGKCGVEVTEALAFAEFCANHPDA
jgi:hypothetical protein